MASPKLASSSAQLNLDPTPQDLAYAESDPFMSATFTLGAVAAIPAQLQTEDVLDRAKAMVLRDTLDTP